MDVFKTLILDTPDSLDNISGILPVVNGGTGADNASDARVNLLPDYTGNANKVLSLNGTATDVEWTSNGAGDVAGPASSTDNAVARFDSTTGKVIQNSGVTISDANLLTADALSINNNTTLGSSNSDTVTFNARIASEFTPATDNTYDLGRTGHEWRDLYLDGTANIDSLIADTADINGGTIDGTTIGATTPAAGTFSQVNSTGAIIATGAGSFGDDTDITGDLTVTGDAEINGLTVGRGSGNVIGNTASGYTALYSNTTGDRNTASGYRSLYSNTTGGDNTASGYAALYSNTTGNKNTASGYVALYSNTIGVNNTGSGYQALYTNTTGVNNTALGMGALLNNTTGDDNTASGYLAGYDNTEGLQNTYVGYNTGRGITTGNYNTVLGANVTGLSATLSNNVIIADGQGNRRINIDGSGNVGIGTSSPDSKLHVATAGNNYIVSHNSAGSTSALLLGAESGSTSIYSWTTPTNTTGVPLKFRVGATESMRIDSAGNVGIGTSSPGTKLSVNGGAEIGVSGGTSTAYGQRFWPIVAGNSAFNIFADVGKLRFTTGGSYDHTANTSLMALTSTGRLGIGTTTPAHLLTVVEASTDFAALINNVTSSGNGLKINAGSNSGDSILLLNDKDANEAMRVLATGDVFIGTTSSDHSAKITSENSSSYNFESRRPGTGSQGHIVFNNPNGGVGTITTSGTSTAYNTSSDYRLKENVVPMSDALQRIGNLKPSRFNFIADDSVVVDGFIAHEVQEVVPEAISGEKDAMRDEEYEVTPAVLDDDGNEVTPAVMDTRSVPDYQGIDQSKLVPLLVGAIQELTARLEALENN